MLVVTTAFVDLAMIAARARGYGALRSIALPHPFQGRSVAEIEALASARAASIRGALTAEGNQSGYIVK